MPSTDQMSGRPAVHGRGRLLLFGTGAGMVIIGVLLHLPDYLMASHDDFMMADMSMGGTMAAGMTVIVLGLLLAVRAVMPDRAHRRRLALVGRTAEFVALDNARLSRPHYVLIAALTVGLVLDTMKPASLGFAMPGMIAEYGISRKYATLLPFLAILGTVIGSILWAYVADIVGRRSAIMLSGVVFVGTSICGFMPSFTWNLVMCFFMGASAGGMLPTVYSLMSESVPARHRSGILVVQSGLGAVLGYLVASGAATLLIPHFSWRALWLLGAPTGLLLLVLCRWIPESPRYLVAAGREQEARQVMRRYGISLAEASRKPAPSSARPVANRPELFRSYRMLLVTVILYGLGWGAVNWGFVTLLPSFLIPGHGTAINRVLFEASLLAVPATIVAAVLYHRWGSRPTMVCCALATAASLVLFAVVRPDRSADMTALIGVLMAVMACAGGMIATLSPYSTEVFPTALRATASGFAAAATKAGGLLAPVLVLAPNLGLLAAVTAVPVVAAGLMLWRAGVETAGRPLAEVEPAPVVEAA
jgi:MFS transporter, putative metabolite:H+ symporter